MQLSAINSVNFQGAKAPRLKRVRVNESSGSYESGIEKAQEKAKQDVHLTTVVGTLGVMLVSITKGRHIVTLATKAAATVGETIAKAAVKTTFGAVNAVQGKKGQAISPDKALDKVSGFANALRNESPKTCDSLVNGVSNFVGNIFGEDKGKAVANFLNKNNMNNPVGLTQGIIAGIAGSQIADEAADRIEGAIDNGNITKAQKAEDAMNTIETLFSVIE